MIFILKESMMNGTVTMDTMVTGIEADNFEEAKKKVKALPNVENFIVQETDTEISMRPKPNPEIIPSFNAFGIMKNEPLKVL